MACKIVAAVLMAVFMSCSFMPLLEARALHGTAELAAANALQPAAEHVKHASVMSTLGMVSDATNRQSTSMFVCPLYAAIAATVS